MSVRQNNASASTTVAAPAPMPTVDMSEAVAETSLAEGNSFNTANAEAPLKRNVVVTIKSSLSDLCLQKSRGTWAPSQEALRGIFQYVPCCLLFFLPPSLFSLHSICQSKNVVRGDLTHTHSAVFPPTRQKKFADLSGATEAQGDLSSIVLHSLKLKHSRSSFPIALGARVTGVDDNTFSSTGESYSTILLPESESARERELQTDDVSLAYEFARKFPGYTASNLAEKGVHEVAQRRFVLVAADHPIVSAIQENADKLQMGEISVRR